MAELARKDGCSLGTSTKKPKTRQECRASVAAAGEGPRPAVAMLAGGLEFIAPVGTRMVAKEAHSEPDLQSLGLSERKQRKALVCRGGRCQDLEKQSCSADL